MKKVLYFFLSLFLIGVVGCSKNKDLSKVKQSYIDTQETCDSYLLKGTLEVMKEDKTLKFNMEISYAKDDFYKVVYENDSLKSKQIILKNNQGVYVLEPMLNKEFKFESSWPSNSSHIYILKSVAQDLKDDESATIEQVDDQIVLSSKISHKVQKKLNNQKVTINKDTYQTQSVAYYEDTTKRMEFCVNSLEYGVTFNSDYFNSDVIMDSETALLGEGAVKSVMFESCGYVLSNTSLDETTSVLSGDTVILNYVGDTSYVITISNSEVVEVASIQRVYNDFIMLDKGIGLVSENALTIYLDNKEIKIYSSAMSLEEMADVINSITLCDVES